MDKIQQNTSLKSEQTILLFGQFQWLKKIPFFYTIYQLQIIEVVLSCLPAVINLPETVTWISTNCKYSINYWTWCIILLPNFRQTCCKLIWFRWKSEYGADSMENWNFRFQSVHCQHWNVEMLFMWAISGVQNLALEGWS